MNTVLVTTFLLMLQFSAVAEIRPQISQRANTINIKSCEPIEYLTGMNVRSVPTSKKPTYFVPASGLEYPNSKSFANPEVIHLSAGGALSFNNCQEVLDFERRDPLASMKEFVAYADLRLSCKIKDYLAGARAPFLSCFRKFSSFQNNQRLIDAAIKLVIQTSGVDTTSGKAKIDYDFVPSFEDGQLIIGVYVRKALKLHKIGEFAFEAQFFTDLTGTGFEGVATVMSYEMDKGDGIVRGASILMFTQEGLDASVIPYRMEII